MAKVKRIIVHCTGEPSTVSRDVNYYKNLFFNVRKWKHFGYHAIVFQNGICATLQPWPQLTPSGGFIDNSTMANGAAGYNSDSLHIAYVGGIDPVTNKPTDTRTPQQKAALTTIIIQWKSLYKVMMVIGHHDLPGVSKACPCFNAIEEYRNV